jgi:hypothetical protein
LNPGSLAPEPLVSPLEAPPVGKKGREGTKGGEVRRVRWRGQRLPSGPPCCDILGAFYSEKLTGPSRAGRVVVLNTNLYYSNNEQTAGMADPGQQFQWLEDVLSNASRTGEMVRPSASPHSSSGLFCEQVPNSTQHKPTHPPEMLPS